MARRRELPFSDERTLAVLQGRMLGTVVLAAALASLPSGARAGSPTTSSPTGTADAAIRGLPTEIKLLSTSPPQHISHDFLLIDAPAARSREVSFWDFLADRDG
jgi:hypothetical protein